jgi:hypothetical protein
MNEKVKKAIEAGDPTEVAWFIGARMAVELMRPKWSSKRIEIAVSEIRAVAASVPAQEMVEVFLRMVGQFNVEKQAELAVLEKMLGPDVKPE